MNGSGDGRQRRMPNVCIERSEPPQDQSGGWALSSQSIAATRRWTELVLPGLLGRAQGVPDSLHSIAIAWGAVRVDAKAHPVNPWCIWKTAEPGVGVKFVIPSETVPVTSALQYVVTTPSLSPSSVQSPRPPIRR